MSVEPRSPATVEKRTNTGVRLPASANSDARVSFGQRLVALEVAVRAGAARVHDALGNALVIEVRDLLAQDEIFEQRGPAQAGLQRVLVVGDRHALVGGEARPPPSARTRSSGPMVALNPVVGPPEPVLGEGLVSVSVLPVTATSSRLERHARRRFACALTELGGLDRIGRHGLGEGCRTCGLCARGDRPGSTCAGLRDGPLTVAREEVLARSEVFERCDRLRLRAFAVGHLSASADAISFACCASAADVTSCFSSGGGSSASRPSDSSHSSRHQPCV